MTINKNQKIALIAGAVILAIVIFATPRIQYISGHKYPANYNKVLRNQFDVTTILIGGGVVAALTFVGYALLKSKD